MKLDLMFVAYLTLCTTTSDSATRTTSNQDIRIVSTFFPKSFDYLKHSKKDNHVNGLIQQLSKNVQEIWEPQKMKQIQPFLSNTIEQALKKSNFDVRTLKFEKQANIRRKRQNISSPTNVTTLIGNATLANTTISFIRQSMLAPLVAAADILTRAPLVQMAPPLFIIVLVIRTVLAILDGTLSYIATVGVTTRVLQSVRDVFDALITPPKT